jgi:hypothetical protein
MSKKYFESKKGSLEEISTQIATEQSTITKPELNIKLTAEKTYFETKPGSLSDAAAKVVSEALDPVNKDAVKKKFDNRKDKDIDNDGDVDSTDKYLHKRRAAISKSVKEEAVAVYTDKKTRQVKSKKFKDETEAKDWFRKNDVAAGQITFKPASLLKKEAVKETHTFMKSKVLKRQKSAGGEKEVINPIKEATMDKFHKMKDDGKSAEEISKALKLDLSSVKKLMESRMKEIAIDLMSKEKGGLSAEEFKKKYGESKAEMQNKLNKSEAVKEPYAIGMAAAMKAKKDKPPLEKSTITKAHDIAKAIMKKEQDISKAAVDKFHTKLDKLVHKSFGHSSDEKKTKTEKKTYKSLRAETQPKNQTMTGQKPAVIDTEPKTQHI